MKVIPFGEVLEDRMELSKKFGLVKMVGNIWILTEKCRKNYNSVSYIEYLRGERDKPIKGGKTEPALITKPVVDSREEALQELLAL